MENRGQKYHRGRLAEALREEIVAIVEGELDDPRIGLVAVNEVQMAPDGKLARVFVDVTGSEEEMAESIEGLNAARGYITSRAHQPPGQAPHAGCVVRSRPFAAAWRAYRGVVAENRKEEAIAIGFELGTNGNARRSSE